MDQILLQIGLLIIFATIVGLIVRFFKQPLLPFYIIAGLFIGPILGIVSPSDTILSLSEVGIAFLLFIAGIEIGLGKLKKGSSVITLAAIVGLIEIIILLSAGFGLGKIYGFDLTHSFYIAVTLALSSTMIVVKLLSDKRELTTIHGKISITVLLIQDIIAIVFIGFITSLNNFSFGHMGMIFVKIVILVLAAVLFNKFLYPKLFKFAAKSNELFFLTTVAIALGFGLLSEAMGLSLAIGAFIAGVSLANLEYSHEMTVKIQPLRDFFATLFFVTLGLLIVPEAIKTNLNLIIIISIITIVIKPIVLLLLLSVVKFKSISSLRASLALSQVSEFTLVIGGLGLALGQIDKEFFSVLALTLIITSITSSYALTYMRFFAEKLQFLGKKIERKNCLHYEKLPKNMEGHAVIFGYHRVGQRVVGTLNKLGKKIIVVDFDPDVIEKLEREKINHLYGDMGDKEVLDKVNIKQADVVVSTVPDQQDNCAMIGHAKKENKKITIYVTAAEIEDAIELYEAGANYVILPHFLGGEHTSLLLERFCGDESELLKIREKHLNELQNDLNKEND